jgi:hypothetical protein
MTKPTTVWTDNTNKNTTVTFSSSAVTYNSATTLYSGWDPSLPNPSKNSTSWTSINKNNVRWDINVNSVSSDIYDALTTYDTIYTYYDGNQDINESPIQTKEPAIWSLS